MEKSKLLDKIIVIGVGLCIMCFFLGLMIFMLKIVLMVWNGDIPLVNPDPKPIDPIGVSILILSIGFAIGASIHGFGVVKFIRYGDEIFCPNNKCFESKIDGVCHNGECVD